MQHQAVGGEEWISRSDKESLFSSTSLQQLQFLILKCLAGGSSDGASVMFGRHTEVCDQATREAMLCLNTMCSSPTSSDAYKDIPWYKI